MALRKATLIFNPNAGSLNWRELVGTVSADWRQRGWQVSVTPTERTGHATELARIAAHREDELVFAAGGDGTMHEVANGLAHSETIMAPLPVGTANILAKELGIPTPSRLNPAWWSSMLATLADGRVQNMDLGCDSDGRYWMLWASTGADGFIIDRIEPRTPAAKRWGMLGYGAKVLRFLPSFRGISGRVTVDGRTYEGDFLMVNISNCRRYGAGEFNLNKGAVLDDGLFEVWIFRGKSWPMLLRYTLAVGLDSQDYDPNIEVATGSTVHVETDEPAPYHLDAEPAGRTPMSCRIQPGALRVLVPQTSPPGLFQRPGQPLS